MCGVPRPMRPETKALLNPRASGAPAGDTWKTYDFPYATTMTLRIPLFFIAVLAPLALSPSSRAAVIANGSFESPDVAVGTFDTFGNASTAITGWVVVGFDATVVSGPFPALPMIFQAQDGNQFLDLTGPGTNSSTNGVVQSVATIPGQLYSLSFHVGSGTDFSTFAASTVDLSIDGGARVGYTNPNIPATHLDWQQFVVEFTATGLVTDIAFYNGSGAGNHLSGLDNVAITAIPESSAIPVLLGAFSLGGVLLRWRRSAP